MNATARDGNGDGHPPSRPRPSVSRTEATVAVEADEEIRELSERELLDRIGRLRRERGALDPGAQLSDSGDPGPC